MLRTSSISISPEATMPAISCRFIAVILALTLAAAPAAAQIVCQVTAHVGCFTDYIQSRRCYPVGPIDVTSQVTACMPSPAVWHAVKPHPHVNRWSAPRTAPSCPTSTRPSSASPNSSFRCVALRERAVLSFSPRVHKRRLQIRRAMLLRDGFRFYGGGGVAAGVALRGGRVIGSSNSEGGGSGGGWEGNRNRGQER